MTETIKIKANQLIEFLETKKFQVSGKNYMMRCPFHDEKTPSFSISPEEGVYHCFGCSRHGELHDLEIDLEIKPTEPFIFFKCAGDDYDNKLTCSVRVSDDDDYFETELQLESNKLTYNHIPGSDEHKAFISVLLELAHFHKGLAKGAKDD